MRIRDWSSDVCSSDLLSLLLPALCQIARQQTIAWVSPPYLPYPAALAAAGLPLHRLLWVRAARERSLWTAEQCLRDRKRVVSGKGGSVRLGLGGRRLIKKKNIERSPKERKKER